MTMVNGYDIKPNFNLSYADLRGANLRNADLSSADMHHAALEGADLYRASLRYSNLMGANLDHTYLVGADLRGANLWKASLRYANLSNVILGSATLKGADLTGARLPPFQICPEEGSFIAYKKALAIIGEGSLYRPKTFNGFMPVVVKLYIPAHAKRTSNLVGRKCRASEAKVLSISGGDGATTAYSLRDVSFKYEVGKYVKPNGYDDDIRIECTKGIHFFMTRQEAVDYEY